jgi:hypothetical protein
MNAFKAFYSIHVKSQIENEHSEGLRRKFLTRIADTNNRISYLAIRQLKQYCNWAEGKAIQLREKKRQICQRLTDKNYQMMNQSLAKLEDWRIHVKYNLRRNLGNVLKLLKETDHRLVNMIYQGLHESARRNKAFQDNKNKSSALMVRLCRKLTDSAFTLTHQAM